MVCSIILFMGDRDALPENGQDYQVFTVAERSTENNQNEWNNGDLFQKWPKCPLIWSMLQTVTVLITMIWF